MDTNPVYDPVREGAWRASPFLNKGGELLGKH